MSTSKIEMFAALAFLICLVNAIFIALVWQRGSLNKLQNALLLSFGLSDFVVGVAVMPASILCSLPNMPKCHVCLISFVLYRFMNISSSINLLAVIYERYLKIVHPFWFCSHEYTILRSVYVVSSLWLTSFAVSVIPLTWVLPGSPCKIDTRKLRKTDYFEYACSALIILLILLMVFAFARIFLIARKHLREMRTAQVSSIHSHDHRCITAESPTITDDADDMSMRRQLWRSEVEGVNAAGGTTVCSKCKRKTTHHWLSKQIRVLLRFVAMVAMFTLVWGTYFFMSINAKASRRLPNNVLIVIQLIHFGKSLVNPWILTVNNNDFKLWTRFWRQVTSMCRKDDGRNTEINSKYGGAETVELHGMNGSTMH